VTRRLRVAAHAAALALALAALWAPAPASAVAGTTSGQSREVRDLPGCRAYGSASGFGIACAGPGSAGGTPLSQLVPGGLPRCWHEEPPEGFEAPPRPGPGRWWLRTCLDGLDLRSLQVAPGGLRISYGYDHLPPGRERTLTDVERFVVDALVARGQVPIPFPVVSVSPSSSPRVGELVAFSLSGPSRTRTLRVGDVAMFAELTRLRVEPEGEGPGRPVVECTGPGRPLTADDVARAERTGATDLGPDVCEHRYGRSSFRAGSGRDADRYPVRVTAFWEVVFDDGARLGPFGKEAVNEVRVAEVQTLVVTGSGSR
jgi:hypothetical protein